MSIAKATRMNSCLKRRNPYKIYTKNKKDQFFNILNKEYHEKIVRINKK